MSTKNTDIIYIHLQCLRGGTKAERLANQLLNQTPVELIAALQVLNAKAGRNEETLT